jgi:predicted AAA+ superfamily ATPase
LGSQLEGSNDPGLTIVDLAERITVGGWPGHLGRSAKDAAQANRDYIEQIRHVDVSRVAEGRRDPNKVGRLIQSLARNVATEVAVTVLAADAGGADRSLSRDTVTEYLDILERLMIVEDQPAWAPHLRSKAILRSSPKRHFADPSLAVAAVGASPERLLKDVGFLCVLFESMVIRDLRVFAQSQGGQVFHYRDNNGLEVDAIVQLDDGRWAAFEIELGVSGVDAAAETLLRFLRVIDTERTGEPAMLGVITGTGFAHTRRDGVGVVPAGTLGP